MTAPFAHIAATEEVLNLYAGGLVPVEIAMPAVLHSIGTTKEDIDAAVDKATSDRDGKKQEEDEEKIFAKKDRDLSLEERKATLDGAKKERDLTGKDNGSSRGRGEGS